MFHLHFSENIRMRLACSYFFACAGLSYGSIMSRMPALRAQTGIDEAQVGIALLSVGIGSLITLPLAGWIISLLGSRRVLRIGGVALLAVFPCVGLAVNHISLCLLLAAMGMSIGLAEVSMNTQAILLERRLMRPCMSSMHAMFSVGGLLGALGGSFFASIGCSPLLNFLLISALTFCLFVPAFRGLQRDSGQPAGREGEKRRFSLPPLTVMLCGVLAMCCYAAEGSVAEWGSLLLYDDKGASEGVAALVFAAFSVSMAVFRFLGDRLREHFGNFWLMLALTSLATCGMLVVLLSPWPVLCLLGYAFMGVGMSVVVPIIFSEVGSCSRISAGSASAVVSTLAYAGQLLFPPVLGLLGSDWGLSKAMRIVVLLCLSLVFGSFLFRKKNSC